MNGERDSSRERFADMSSEERQTEIQQIREDRKAVREARQNMTDEERQADSDDRREKARESRANNVSIYQQMALGADNQDIVCPEEKELVIKVSNGSPKCLGSNAVLMLIDRGVVAYPDSS